MKNIIKYKKIIILIIIVLVILALAFLFQPKKIEAKKTELKINTIQEEVVEKIKVDIKGAVNNPGVYEIDKLSRVIDLINLSGGLKENANTKIINLSKSLEDQMVIIIYTNEEIEEYLNKNNTPKIEYIYLEANCVCPDSNNDSCITKNNLGVDSISSETQNDTPDVININTASKEQLMTLSGIGESKANKIIEYRNKTPFSNIIDIKNVTGIGDSIFEKIKEKITV